MAAVDQASRSAAARVAAISRHHGPCAAAEARRDLRAARLEDYVARIVSEAPPLTDEQATRIASLLKPAMAGGAR